MKTVSSGKKVGYVRVSTVDQNPERQLEGVQLDKKFIDKASAKSMDRPQLLAMLDYIREDDILIVHSMDRLARSLRDLKKMVDDLISRNITVEFIKERLTFGQKENAMSTLMLHLMGAFAEFEYSFIRERQAEGIRLAKLKGTYNKGRPMKLSEFDVKYIKEQMNTRMTKIEIAKNLGITRCTLYKYLKRIDSQEKRE